MHLVLLTSSYPFGKAENFLNDELPLLAENFRVITILAGRRTEKARPVPANCEVLVIDPEQAESIWRRLPLVVRALLREWRLWSSPRKVKYMLASIAFYVKQASAIVKTARSALTDRQALPTCFYSYWLDYHALAAAQLSSSFPNSTAVSRAHGFDVYTERHPHNYLPFRTYLVERLDAVFPISDSGMSALHLLPTRRAKISTLRLGVTRLLSEEPEGSTTRCHSIVSIGSLIPLKRIELITEALSRFNPGDNMQWHHFGDGPMKRELHQLASGALKIPYTFHGHIRSSELRKFLSSVSGCAILINTSSTEGIPVSMMECMACGIPCIGTNVGGVSEIIEDAVNGRLMSANPTPLEVFQTLRQCIELGDKQWNDMCRQAYRTWDERYQAEKNFSLFAKRLVSINSPVTRHS